MHRRTETENNIENGCACVTAVVIEVLLVVNIAFYRHLVRTLWLNISSGMVATKSVRTHCVLLLSYLLTCLSVQRTKQMSFCLYSTVFAGAKCGNTHTTLFFLSRKTSVSGNSFPQIQGIKCVTDITQVLRMRLIVSSASIFNSKETIVASTKSPVRWELSSKNSR